MSHLNGEFLWLIVMPCVALTHVPFRCLCSIWKAVSSGLSLKLKVYPAWSLPKSHLDSESFWLMPCIVYPASHSAIESFWPMVMP